MDSSNGLNALRMSLLKEIQEKDESMKELRKKLDAIDLVSGMMEKKKGVNVGKLVDDRFKDLGLTEAVFKCLNEPPRWYTLPEITKSLKTGGVKTRSKNLYSVILATLKRMVSREQVEVNGKGKGKGFRIKAKQPSTETLFSRQLPP